MRRKFWIILATIVIGVPATAFVATRSSPARVLGKDEHIIVDSSSGRWYHRYTVHLGVARSTDSSGVVGDTVSVPVAREQYDASRVGARVRLGRIASIRRLSWVADSQNDRQTLVRFLQAQRRISSEPKAVSALDAQTAGLARVIAVHPIERRKSAPAEPNPNGDRSRWIHLVEVEFWAQRTRTLVRTIDVIDAGSIPGLHPGDVLQMHFDQRNPRVLRLDDGMRTFATAAD